MSKNPAFQFYPADWLNDIKLQSCSLEAQGLLINLMCLMHQSNEYGYLLINGHNPSNGGVSHLLRLHCNTYSARLQELLLYGVLQKDENDIVFCERMIKDEYIRNVRREAGKLGGSPLLKQKVKQVSKQNSTPSSSSSSSSSKNNYSSESDEIRLSTLLFSYIKERDPKAKEPNYQKWGLEINKLIRIDKREPREVEEIIVWCQENDFWQNNILSTKSLRKQFTQLKLKKEKGEESPYGIYKNGKKVIWGTDE